MELNVTDANFKKEVLESDVPVVVDFWAPWCGPCKMMGPVFADVAKEYAGKVKVAKMNVDENATPGQFNVMSIPTMIFVKNGQVVDQAIGAMPKAALVERVEKLLA